MDLFRDILFFFLDHFHHIFQYVNSKYDVLLEKVYPKSLLFE